MAVDLDRIRETRLDINGRELGMFSGHVTQLLVYDIPAMVDEIESLRAEIAEHRAIVKHKQDFIMGEPRGIHAP